MPEASTAFALDGKTPGELEQRRREIVSMLQSMPHGFDDPNVPIETLQELAAITATLRRKSSGPPKVAKTNGATSKKATVDDLSI